MKKIFFYIALICLLPATTFARWINDGKHSGPVSDYVKTHIMPVVTAKRQAFDAFLSATEKNELASIREQLQQLHESRKAAMLQRQEENAAGDWTANSGARHENHIKMKELMAQVQLIADNHKDDLDNIFNSLASQKEQWKNDIAKIVSTAGSTGESGVAELPSYHRFGGGMNRGFKMWSRTGFLLLDASTTASSVSDRQENALPDVSAQMSIYPNPAANEFLLNLSGIAAENKLTVTDMTGKVIFEKENVTPSEAISCSELNNGIYFVQLSSSDQTINQKLIINH